MINAEWVASTGDEIAIHLVTESNFKEMQWKLTVMQTAWLNHCDIMHSPTRHFLLPNEQGELSAVYKVIHDGEDMWSLAALVPYLPEGRYYLDFTESLTQKQLTNFHLAWGLAAYSYNRYRKDTSAHKTLSLVVDEDDERAHLVHLRDAIFLARDLINTPTEDLAPADLADVCQEIAGVYAAKMNVITGDKLIKKGFPVVHLVGRSSSNAPCLIDLHWGPKDAPKVTVIGKGVCFDTGGLDIKPANGMRFMKKDMGGAAVAIALAQLIMAHKLPIRLQLIIPAVENAVAGDSMRPGDVVIGRSGHSIEITNTDAEGRLILGDALTYAVEQEPDYLFDFATLTGAARVALGPSIAPMYTLHDDMADQLSTLSQQAGDPIWRMPLYSPYRANLNSDIADMVNSDNTPFAGSIHAALYLKTFVPDEIKWAHFDIYGWNPKASPGKPKGGEPSALRGVFDYVQGIAHAGGAVS